jgi:hypothetical protein
MGLFSTRNPRKEVTTTVKTYGVEYDKEPTKQKKGLFAQKKEPEPEPQQDTMQIDNPEQNENQEENQYGGTY